MTESSDVPRQCCPLLASVIRDWRGRIAKYIYGELGRVPAEIRNKIFHAVVVSN